MATLSDRHAKCRANTRTHPVLERETCVLVRKHVIAGWERWDLVPQLSLWIIAFIDVDLHGRLHLSAVSWQRSPLSNIHAMSDIARGQRRPMCLPYTHHPLRQLSSQPPPQPRPQLTPPNNPHFPRGLLLGTETIPPIHFVAAGMTA